MMKPMRSARFVGLELTRLLSSVATKVALVLVILIPLFVVLPCLWINLSSIEAGQGSGSNAAASHQSESVQTINRGVVDESVHNELVAAANDAVQSIDDAANETSALSDQLTDIQVGSGIISSALVASSDGTSQLAQGLGTMATAATGIAQGTAGVDTGVQTLASKTGELASGTQTIDTYAKELATGAQALDEQAQTLSQNVGVLATGASSIAGAATGLNAMTGLVAQGADGLNTSVDGLGQSAKQLNEGAQGVKTSVGGLKLGVDAIASILADTTQYPTDDAKIAAIKGIMAGQDGLSLSALAQGANTGAEALATQTALLSNDTQGLPALETGVKSLNSVINVGGIPSPDTPSMKDLAKTVDKGVTGLSDGVGKLSGGLTAFQNQGTASLATGTAGVAQGTGGLVSGTSLLDSGVQELAKGTSVLATGADGFAKGASTIASSVDTLGSSFGKIAAGSVGLQENIGNAQETVAGVSNSLDDEADDTRSKLKTIASKEGTRSTQMNTGTVQEAQQENSDTGLVLLLAVLALWIGALLIVCLLKPLHKRMLASATSPIAAAAAGYVPMACIGIAQALLVGVLVQFGLQVNIELFAVYYALLVLASLVFVALMQMLVAANELVGKLFAVFLAVAQTAVCINALSLETLGQTVQGFAAFLPVAQAMKGLSLCAGATDTGQLVLCAVQLLVLGIVVFALTVFIAHRRQMVRLETLYKALEA